MSAVKHHGSQLPRGLMTTSKSPRYQGRFGRMFRSLPAGAYGKTDDASRRALRALGEKMVAPFDAPKDGKDVEESGIPALYTYFGQFIDHDITFDPMTTLIQRSDPDALTDFRTPALDLDNLYGRGPQDQPYMYNGDSRTFLPGKPIAANARDLPRNSVGRALIGDPRNDENSIVSQLQGLMLQFHNRVAAEKKNQHLKFPEIQQIVQWHYQWVVIHDFLPKIVVPSVLRKLKTDDKYDRKKLEFFHWKNEPFMPVEFSVAAYRFGHSMVRPGYRLNNTKLLPIFRLPAGAAEGNQAAGREDLRGFQSIAPGRAIDWGRFINLPGDIRSYGTNRPTDSSTKRRLQFAYRIDTSLADPLSHLPRSVVSDQPRSLPERNLIRGLELGLPTGQAVAQAMGLDPLSDDEIKIGEAVDRPQRGDVISLTDLIRRHPELTPFTQNCPLWTYILAEAAHHGRKLKIPVTENIRISTPQLGPVGGRIVAEVILGLMFGDSDSFLRAWPTWTPTIGSEGESFALPDLVNYALGR